MILSQILRQACSFLIFTDSGQILVLIQKTNNLADLLTAMSQKHKI